MFLTQRLANRYPLETKLRSDPSSFGQRFLSTLAEGFEKNQAANKLLIDSHIFSSRVFGHDHFYLVHLLAEDYIELQTTSNGYVYPDIEITGKADGNDITFTRAEEISELIVSVPERLSVKSTQDLPTRLVFTSATNIYYKTDLYDRLWVYVSGSTNYWKKTEKRNRDKSGLSTVHIKGLDNKYRVIEEVISVPDDGVYVTLNAFLEVTEVKWEGFDGNVDIYAGSANTVEIDPYRILVFDDFEGALELRIVDGGVEYSAQRLKLGYYYRGDAIESMENREDLFTAKLLDTSEGEIIPEALAVSPLNGLLYVLSNDTLYLYQQAMPSFEAPSVEETVTNYFRLLPTSRYPTFNSTEDMWTRLSQMRSPIKHIVVKRVSPSGDIKYLQTDKVTWGNTYSEISTVSTGKLSVTDWQDFKFSSTYTELGVWEYQLTAVTTVDTTVSTTSVYVPFLTAVKQIALPNSNNTNIWFNDIGKLCIGNNERVTCYEELLDKYIYDYNAQTVYLSNNVDDLLVKGSSYTAQRFQISTGLDDFGLKYGISRLFNEDIETFKDRILFFQREELSNSYTGVREAIKYSCGEPNVPVFKIEIDPVYQEAELIIEAFSIKYRQSSSSEWSQLDLTDRANGYFMEDVYQWLVGFPELTITTLNYEPYVLSNRLCEFNSLRTSTSFLLNDYVTNLGFTRIQDIRFTGTDVFANEVEDISSMANPGDYYVDKANGIVFSYDIQKGTCWFTYQLNPIYLFTNEIKVFQANDTSVEKIAFTSRNNTLDLTHKGVELYNAIHHIHPMEWGV